jgi:hypothetical protein
LKLAKKFWPERAPMGELTEVEEQAQDYMDNQSRYLIQRELGAILRVSSHVVGRKLRELGLRGDKAPTPKAIKNKMVEGTMQDRFIQWRWNENKVLPLLRRSLEKQESPRDESE